MKARLINEQGVKTYALIFERGDEVAATLLKFAEESPAHLRRRSDPESGLALISL